MPLSATAYRSFIDRTLRGELKPLRLDDTSGLHEEWPTTVIPINGIYLSAVSTDPGLAQASGGLGYGSWSRYAQGLCVVGVHDSDSDWAAGNTIGAKTTTPAGSVSAPTFTGSSVASQSVSAGTPAGTTSAPTFTGAALSSHTHTFTGSSAQATSLVSAGTPSGANSAPTFTGNALANHAHELPVQLVSGTLSRQLASTVFGTGTSRAAQSQQTETANTTSAAVALSQAVSAGTPSGTVSAPTFTGNALTTHQHTLTPAGTNSSDSAGTPSGTVSAPTFTGSALAGHAHNVTAAGTVSAPTFTGQAMSVVQPSIAVYVWRRVG